MNSLIIKGIALFLEGLIEQNMRKSVIITAFLVIFLSVNSFGQQDNEIVYLENMTLSLDSIWTSGYYGKEAIDGDANYLKVKDGQAIFNGRFRGQSLYFQGIVKDVKRQVYDNGDVVTNFYIDGTGSSHGTLSFILTYRGKKGYTQINVYKKISHYNRMFDVHEITDEENTIKEAVKN
jgi:hypothetical protein